MINVDQFVNLVESKQVQVKIKLKKLSNILNCGVFQLQDYDGKEKKVYGVT